jgi:hypothetical protein
MNGYQLPQKEFRGMHRHKPGGPWEKYADLSVKVTGHFQTERDEGKSLIFILLQRTDVFTRKSCSVPFPFFRRILRYTTLGQAQRHEPLPRKNQTKENCSGVCCCLWKHSNYITDYLSNKPTNLKTN